MGHLRTILPYFRPYRRGVILGLLLVIVANAFSIVKPYLLKLGIDALGREGTTSSTIAGYAGIIVVAALLGGAARYGMRELLNGISRRMECDLRNDFFRHLLRLDAGFFTQIRTGDLMSRATNDTLAVRQAVGPAVMYTVNTVVMVGFSLALMLWISPRLTLLALIPMAVLPPVVLLFGRIIHRRFERIQEQFATLSTMVQENLTGVRIVRAYVQEGAQAGEFDALNQEYLNRNMDLVKAAGLFHPSLSLLTGLAMVVVLWFGGQQVMSGEITVGDFVAFIFYLIMLTWPMIALGWVVNLYQRGAASMGRINRIMEMEPEISAPERPAPLPRVREDGARIEFRGVSFRYPGTDRWVLRDVSFEARPGQRVAVVGPTGSGKTTLVSLIPRLYDPDRGRILLNGVPLPELDPAELRRIVGMVPQDPFLFSDTIERNISLGITGDGPGPGDDRAGVGGGGVGPERDGAGPGEVGSVAREGRAEDGGPSDRELDTVLTPEEGAPPGAPEGAGEWSEEVIVEAARIAQLHDSIRSFPRGYETYLGERGINLSGGQKQRATLARALARDPAILILDDALSAVDTQTEARILRDLRGAMEGRTSFIISHRASAVMDAELILVLVDGEIVERGTHDELVATGGAYQSLLRRQMLEQDLERDVVGAAGG